MTDTMATGPDSWFLRERTSSRMKPSSASSGAIAPRRASRPMGLIAIAITAVFLVVLFADILRNGLPAFWQHSLVLDVAGEGRRRRSRRQEGRRRRSAAPTISRSRAMRSSAAIPGIEGRTAQRKLTQLLSTGAADELRDRLVAEPGLVGQTVKTRLLLSDDADLYFKGAGTHDRRARRPRHRDAERHDRRDHGAHLGQRFPGRARRHQARAWRNARRRCATEAARLERTGDAKQADRDQGACATKRRQLQARVDQSARRRGARRQAAEPAGRHQRRPRQDHQARRQRHHRRGAAAA